MKRMQKIGLRYAECFTTTLRAIYG